MHAFIKFCTTGDLLLNQLPKAAYHCISP